MRKMLSVAVVAVAVTGFSAGAEARGCIKGALVGGLAGHAAGHTFAGAAAGCVAGRAIANHRSRNAQPVQGPGPGARPVAAH